jgi:phospholipid/cholesterol/gamma-HCH transport system ATP-binding protein
MIEVRHLAKRFEALEVFSDVSLDVHDGETLAIIGHSGVGKSVLMKHFVGLLRPDEGHVLVDGTDVGTIPYDELRRMRRRFGVLFQGGALFDSMTTSENIAFPLRHFSAMGGVEVRERVQECLDLVRLSSVGPKKPSELSGGMRKRAALARAIALEPEYILYDEPTTGLDPETSNTINDLIIHLSDELNVTSVVVTHDMHSVLSIADRVAFLHDQGLEWIGPVSGIHDCSNPHLNSFVEADEYQVGSTAPSLSGSSA